MVVALVVIGVAVAVGIGGYIFGSRYEVKLHKRTRVEILDEDEEDHDDHDRR